MSRVGARHAAIVVAMIVAVVAGAVWLWNLDPAPETSPPPTAPVAKGKAVRVAPTVPRRVRAADATAPSKSDVPAGPPATLVVCVVSGADRAPLAGAAVYVIDAKSDDWRAETDAAGAARFEDLPAGRTEVRAEMGERIATNRTIALAAAAKETVEVTLDVAVALEGSVVDGETNVALAAADVELVETVGSEQRSIDGTTTDSAGRFRFAKVRPSTVLLVRAALQGHGRTQQQTVTPSPGGGTGRVELRMWKTGVLRGVVRGPDGSAVYDGWVHVGLTAFHGQDAVTADDGSYVVHDVPLGSPVVVTAGAPEWADAEPVPGVVVDRASGEATLDIVLRRATTLVVRVFDPSGQPVDAGLLLDGSTLQGGRWTKEHLYVRERLTPGKHVLRAEMRGLRAAEREVELPDGERIEIELRIDQGVTIAGVVVDEAGNPVEGARACIAEPASAPDAASSVTTYSRGRVLRGTGPRLASSSGTPADGTFRIDGVAPGPKSVFVVVDGVVAPMPGAGPDGATAEHRIVEAPAQGVRLVVGRVTRLRLRVVAAGTGAKSVRMVARQGPADAVANLPFDPDTEKDLEFDFVAWTSEGVVRCAVTPGPSALRLSVPGFAPVVLPMNATAGTTTDLGEIRLDEGVTLSGRVVDAEGHAVAGAGLVPLSGLLGGGPLVTQSDGSFAVEHVARGAAVLRAVAPSRSGATFVPAAERAGMVTITLRSDGVLRGTVTDGSGAAMKRVTVSIRHGIVSGTSDPGRRASVTTRDDGSFAWPVACGPCRVSAGGAWVETDVPEGGEARVRVVVR